MLRFICKHKVLDKYSGVNFEAPVTIDLDVPELERLLVSGGYGIAQGYDVTVLDSVEVIEPKIINVVEEKPEEMPF